jgi:hypothetical protein
MWLHTTTATYLRRVCLSSHFVSELLHLQIHLGQLKIHKINPTYLRRVCLCSRFVSELLHLQIHLGN